jgi:hypothetical protein
MTQALTLKEELAAINHSAERVEDNGQFIGMRVLNAEGVQVHQGRILKADHAAEYVKAYHDGTLDALLEAWDKTRSEFHDRKRA